MACCADPATPLVSPDAAAPGRCAGASALGRQFAAKRGQATGTLYPNADNGVVIEIDPRDAQARPDHWEGDCDGHTTRSTSVMVPAIYSARSETATRYTGSVCVADQAATARTVSTSATRTSLVATSQMWSVSCDWLVKSLNRWTSFSIFHNRLNG